MKHTSPLSLGFSPCPNDTFIFDAMVNGIIDTGDLQFQTHLEDVETLNQWAFEGKLAITKLSYSTILQVSETYALLDSGSALGMGVGPLLICTEATAQNITKLSNFLKQARIAIPGAHTTANLLFTLAHPEATNKTEVIFSDIEQQVLEGNFDCGLVIHESRFTYAQRGLHKLMDMGDWWEQTYKAPIPLGGICIKRSLPKTTALKVQQLIQQSVAHSWRQYPILSHYITAHAQEMEESVMRQHINLYVNDYSNSLGINGRNAIQTLFDVAQQNNIIKQTPTNIFI
jgi:1,4-dihydroxy-6-naphthoate synthase